MVVIKAILDIVVLINVGASLLSANTAKFMAAKDSLSRKNLDRES